MKRLTPEHRARIARGLQRFHERRRAATRISPSDLRTLAQPGSPVRAELRPLLRAAELELEHLVAAVGGDQASAQRVLLAQDCARLGLLVRALMRRFGQGADPDVAAKVGTLISARRASLVALGLDERRVELDLHEYLSQQRQDAQDRSGGPTGNDCERPTEDAPERSHDAWRALRGGIVETTTAEDAVLGELGRAGSGEQQRRRPSGSGAAGNPAAPPLSTPGGCDER